MASRLAGQSSARRWAGRIAHFAIDQLPDTSYARDFETLLNAGTLAYGIRALYRKPPPEVIPEDQAEEEIPDTADDAEPGVTIGAINQAILTGLAIIPRAPRGNPGRDRGCGGASACRERGRGADGDAVVVELRLISPTHYVGLTRERLPASAETLIAACR